MQFPIFNTRPSIFCNILAHLIFTIDLFVFWTSDPSPSKNLHLLALQVKRCRTAVATQQVTTFLTTVAAVTIDSFTAGPSLLPVFDSPLSGAMSVFWRCYQPFYFLQCKANKRVRKSLINCRHKLFLFREKASHVSTCVITDKTNVHTKYRVASGKPNQDGVGRPW